MTEPSEIEVGYEKWRIEWDRSRSEDLAYWVNSTNVKLGNLELVAICQDEKGIFHPYRSEGLINPSYKFSDMKYLPSLPWLVVEELLRRRAQRQGSHD